MANNNLGINDDVIRKWSCILILWRKKIKNSGVHWEECPKTKRKYIYAKKDTRKTGYI